MLKNYLVTAYKVFLRRKIFTGINLLGIVLTLTVLITATAMLDAFIHPTGPEKHSASYLEIDRLSLLTEEDGDQSNEFGHSPALRLAKSLEIEYS